jgi:hypothetical protein
VVCVRVLRLLRALQRDHQVAIVRHRPRRARILGARTLAGNRTRLNRCARVAHRSTCNLQNSATSGKTLRGTDFARGASMLGAFLRWVCRSVLSGAAIVVLACAPDFCFEDKLPDPSDQTASRRRGEANFLRVGNGFELDNPDTIPLSFCALQDARRAFANSCLLVVDARSFGVIHAYASAAPK